MGAKAEVIGYTCGSSQNEAALCGHHAAFPLRPVILLRHFRERVFPELAVGHFLRHI